MRKKRLTGALALAACAMLSMSQAAAPSDVRYLLGWNTKMPIPGPGWRWYWTNNVGLEQQMWDTTYGFLGTCEPRDGTFTLGSGYVLVGHSMGGVRAFGLASRAFSRELYKTEFDAWRSDPANAGKPDDDFAPSSRFISAVITVDSPINGHSAIDPETMAWSKTYLYGSLVLGGVNAITAAILCGLMPAGPVGFGAGTVFLAGLSVGAAMPIAVGMVKDSVCIISGSTPDEWWNFPMDGGPAMYELMSGFASWKRPGTVDLMTDSAFRKKYLPYRRAESTTIKKVLKGYEYECVDAEPPAKPKIVRIPVYEYVKVTIPQADFNPLPDGTIYAHVAGRQKSMDAVLMDNNGVDLADLAEQYYWTIGAMTAFDTIAAIGMACTGQFWSSGIMAAGALSGVAGIAAVAGRQAFWDSIMSPESDGFIPYRNQAYKDRSRVARKKTDGTWDGGVPVTGPVYFKDSTKPGIASFDVNHVTCLSGIIWGGSSFKDTNFNNIREDSPLGEVKKFLVFQGLLIGSTAMVKTEE